MTDENQNPPVDPPVEDRSPSPEPNDTNTETTGTPAAATGQTASEGRDTAAEHSGDHDAQERQTITITEKPEETQKEPATEEKPQEAEAPQDLFDLMGESGKQHKKNKPDPAKQAAGSSGSASKQPEPKRYPQGLQIVYSGHKIDLPREMTGDEILDFLADDFPELTKDTTELTHDEERNRVVPTRKALKKGASQVKGGVSQRRRPSLSARQAPPDDEPRTLRVHTYPVTDRPLPPVQRVLAHDGVYEVRDTPLGTFTARVPASVMLHEAADLKVPRAPVALLEKTLRIFKGRCDREVLLTIVYDHRDGAHHLVWVEQSATATSIDFDPVVENDYLTIFMEIHSHHCMEAFFSATDDHSEVKSGGLYGVIGRVDLDRPHTAFRYSCGTHFRPIAARNLFDDAARVSNLITECTP